MATTLKKYNQKRHFTKTSEPQGKVAKKRAKKLGFVVQHHIASRDHFDFRLEWDGVLKSWAVPKGPSYNNKDKRLAVQVEDHPFDYRTFEGTIPKGEYGGGVVMIWDKGTWEPYGDVDEGLANGTLKFTLHGERLKGKWALVRMKTKDEKNINWLLLKEKDEYENTIDIADYTTSITTGRSMTEIKKHKNEPGTGKKSASGKRAPSLSLDDFTLSHPEKVLYEDAGITKGDVAEYYLAVSERMLPYLQNRIVSAVRCPNGIGTPCFYKKHPAKLGKGVATMMVPVSNGKKEEFYYVEDVYGIMYEVQMNTLEFHTWGSRIEHLEQPDIMVFDLDPDEGMDLERVRQGVKDLKSVVDELSLTTYLKTSGGKGYHVVIPFQPAADWDAFHAFAQNIAKTMEAMWPDRYTSNIRKNKRSDRIFIDYMRNGRGATSIAPYSVRARKGGPVSVPISWKELMTVTPNGISMDDTIARLRKKDPWEDFFQTRQQLK